MTYHLRRSRDAVVEGPYTTDELAVGVQSGRFPRHSLISHARSGTVQSLKRYRRCDWSPIRDVPGLEEILPEPVEGPRTPIKLGRMLRRAAIAIACAGNLIAFINEPRWRAGLLSLSFGTMLAIEILGLLPRKAWRAEAGGAKA